jgi:hypothetical protein
LTSDDSFAIQANRYSFCLDGSFFDECL